MQRLFLSLILAGLIWAIGLSLFISRIPAPFDQTAPRGDGVVVYTGGGARLTAAMEIFMNGAGDRLLISGVHPETSRARLSEIWPGEPETFDCCVDLGHDAETTEGNADELKNWAKDNGFDTIILVTSDYHMPRALATTNGRIADVEIIPYVVSSGYLLTDGRPASANAWRVLAGEYSKFLLARAKAFAASLG